MNRILLPGLQKMTDQEIASTSREQLVQVVLDLRGLPIVQRQLPGVKLLDSEYLRTKSDAQLVELVIDIREASLGRNVKPGDWVVGSNGLELSLSSI